MNYAHEFFFGIYPYICLAVFLLGSLIRFDREQYTWKSDSSQLLKRGQLRWGSNLFHIGILFLFFGHFVGLLTPEWAYSWIISPHHKQYLAMISGGIAGVLVVAGLAFLIHRRLTEPRILATSTRMDIIVLFWLMITVLLGLATIWVSAHESQGSLMEVLALWAQHIVTFRMDAASFIAGVPLVFKVHLVFGMTLFLIFPFSRLVHVWSGFAAVMYVTRAYQVVRTRGRA